MDDSKVSLYSAIFHLHHEGLFKYYFAYSKWVSTMDTFTLLFHVVVNFFPLLAFHYDKLCLFSKLLEPSFCQHYTWVHHTYLLFQHVLFFVCFKMILLCMLKAHGEVSCGGHPRTWRHNHPCRLEQKELHTKDGGKSPPNEGW